MPQNSDQSREILPPPMQPPPGMREFEIVGNYIGKELLITANGEELYRGIRPTEPPGVRWQLRHDISDYPAEILIEIEGCGTPVTFELPQPVSEGPLLIFRDCTVEVIAD